MLLAPTTLSLLLGSSAWAATLPRSEAMQPRAVNGPVISANFPDPSILKVGGTSYAFATNSGGKNIQVATSPDGKTWTVTGADALPDVGSWATKGNTWAPDVIDRGDGNFIMYYAGQSNSTHCVGVATSTTPEGPYTPRSAPFACPVAQGGAIDPAGFQDTDGTRYVVYKVDGSSLGGGGACGNADGTHPTPIMLQRFEADGITPTGDPVQLLDRNAQADGPLIEAPALILHDGTYALFYSSHCFNTNQYDIKYATASSVAGPYTRANAPLLVTGNSGLTAPGGADPTPDGSSILFHGTLNADPLTRGMYTASLTWNGKTVSAE